MSRATRRATSRRRPPRSLLRHAGVALLLAALPLAATAGAPPAPADADLDAAQRLQREAAAAYREGDLEGFVSSLEKARAANPASQATRYNLACGYARTGRDDAAMELLSGLAAARIDFRMADDPDLETLRRRPDFQTLVAELRRATAPVVASVAVHDVQQLALVPEGIAVDPATGRAFFGSMRTGEIYVIGPGGMLSKLAEIRHRGSPLAALGMAVDGTRGLLWAVGASSFLAEGHDGAAPVVTGVFGFDLVSGAETRRHLWTGAEGPFNDVALAPDGSLYLTGHTLARVSDGAAEPRPVDLATPLTGSNGIAFAPDGHTLYVSVYPVGLARVDLRDGTWRYLEEPADTPLIGIDGLYWYRGDLVGIQNGLQPWRLLRMTLDEAGTAVTAVRVVELGNPEVTPTTGAVVGDGILYVGQAPAPDEPPSHFPAALAPVAGRTVIRRAPLD